MSSESTLTKLLTQEDWHDWYNFIRSKATAVNIWRFVDPDQESPSINLKPDLSYYTRSRSAAIPPSNDNTGQEPPPNPIPDSTPSDPQLDQDLATADFAGRLALYRIKLAEYTEAEKRTAELSEVIRETVGPNFKSYLSHEHNPHKLLKTLQRVAKPSEAAIEQSLKTELERLEVGPKRLGVEAWLLLYTKISKKAEQLQNPLYEATTRSLIKHLVNASQYINPSFYSEFSFAADKRTLNLTLEELISEFNISYKPPKGNRAAFPTLSGEPSNTTQDKTPDTQNQSRGECPACGGFHNVKRCRNLFEELRPDGWIVGEHRERRCQEYIKTPEGKALYLEQKKHFAAHPPEKPTLKPSTTKRKASQEPESPNLSAAAVVKQPSAAFITREPPDIDLSISWTYDTGTNTHVGNNLKHFINYSEVQPTYMATGSSSSAIHGYGDVKLSIQCGQRTRKFNLKNVAYCPGFHTNLVCGDILFEAGVKIDQEANCLTYRKTGGRFADLIRYDKFRLLKAYAHENTAPSAYAANSKKIFNLPGTRKVWHQRLGHCDMESIDNLPAAAEGVVLLPEPSKNTVFGPPLCEPCTVARIQQQNSRKPAPHGTYPFERVHFDVIILDMKGKRSFTGDACIAHFWCDFTKYHRAWPLPNHTETALLPIFESIIAFAKKFGPGVKWIHSDDEKGIGDQIEALLNQHGIIREISAPYTPQQNGAAERSGRTITERGRAILDEAGFSILLWPQIVYAVIFLLNRTPIRSLKWKTPYGALYGIKPRLFGLRVLGSLTYVLIPEKERVTSDKFASRALKGYLIGFEASNIYRVWMPTTNRILRTRDVKIDETVRYKSPQQPDEMEISQQETNEMNRIQDLADIHNTNEFDWIEDLESIPSAPIHHIHVADQPPKPDALPQTDKPDAAPGLITPPATPNDPELSQASQASESNPNSSQPSPPETTPLQTSGGENSQPQTETTQQQSPDHDAEPERRSKRQKTRTQKAAEMPNQDLRKRAFHAENAEFEQIDETQNICDDSAQHVLQAFFSSATRNFGHIDDLPPEPKSWKEMGNHPLSAHFRAAAHKEIRTLIAKHTWDEVAWPTGAANILPTTWRFKYKQDTDGYVVKLKARLCARGDLQLGVNKQDVAAITGAYRTFRLLMALVAAFDLDVIQLDAVNAFVNADLDEEIYITRPDGYKEPLKHSCLKLRKALYGLRKSPKLWANALSTTIRNLGLIPVPEEPCLFTHPSKLILVFFYVDDILIIGSQHMNSDLEDISQRLMKAYDMRRLDEFKSFLNTTILRDRASKRLWLYQDQYIERLVAIYHQEFAPQAHTPLSGQDLQKYEGQATPNETLAYQRRIGSIIYPASTLRPDIALAASKLAEFMQNPSQAHLAEVNRVIAYLYTTRYLAIEYSSINPHQNAKTLRIASDASFADDNDTRRSTQGYLIKLFNGPIMWQSSRQNTVSTSTTEAELLALSHVGKEVQHMGRIFKAIRFNPEQTIEIECDNQQTVRLMSSEEPTITTKLRHVDVHQFWLRQEVQDGKFRVQWVPTAEMMADGLTKPLNKQAHQAFLDMLGLRDIRHREPKNVLTAPPL